MPNFYCEYCGIYLKHSSPFGRKQHSRGKKHIYNKVEYYSQFLIEFQQQHEQAKLLQQQQAPQPPPQRGFAPPPQMIRPPRGFE